MQVLIALLHYSSQWYKAWPKGVPSPVTGEYKPAHGALDEVQINRDCESIIRRAIKTNIQQRLKAERRHNG